MTYEKCKRILLDAYSDSIVVASFKHPNGYIFSIKPKHWKEDEYVLDGMFKVSSNGDMTEYSPVMNPEEFKLAMKNRIE